MTYERDDDANGLPRSAECEEIVALFDSVGTVAGGILTRLGMSEAAVEAAVQEAFFAFMRHWQAADDPRAWLAGEILKHAAEHRRLRGLGPEPDPGADARHVMGLIHTKAALATLRKSARAALLLLFREKKSYEEIAAELNVSIPYAKRLVTEALAQLRKWKPGPDTRKS